MAKYKYSVLRRYEGHAPREELVKRTAVAEIESDMTPEEMKGTVLVTSIPEDGLYQIRTDGPKGSGFADFQFYRKGTTLVHPGQ